MKRMDTERNVSFIGNGHLGVAQSASMTIGDTVHPIISIGSELNMFAGEDLRKQIRRQTIEVDANGGTSSKLKIVLRRYVVDQYGEPLASGVTVKIGGNEYTTGNGGVITHTLNGETYTTLHDMIDAINALPGFVCYIGDALTTHKMDADDFIDLEETNIPSATTDLLDTLYRDVSEDDIAYVRIGLPRKYDLAPIQIIHIGGSITNAAGAKGQLITDNMDEYKSDASHQDVCVSFTPIAAATAAYTPHVNDGRQDAIEYRGSLVLKVSATDAAGASYKVIYRQVLGCNSRHM